MAKYHLDEITIGADPEFFLSRKGEFVSAHDLVPGTKDKPHPLKNGVALQADGTAVEFNIPPAKTAEEFSDYINDAIKQIRAEIPKEFKFEFVPSVTFPKKYFAQLPKSATELGCMPDFKSNQNGKKSMPIDAYIIGSLRAAGGHIHIGWGEDINTKDQGHFFDCCLFINKLNSYFKNYEPQWDSDKKRAQLYGTGGAFRPKSYGVEYRGLSNRWLEYPKLWPWIFNNTKAIFKHLRDKPPGTTSYNPQYSGYEPNFYYQLYHKHLQSFPQDFKK